VPADRKEAAREGLIRVGKEMDLGRTALWTRVNSLASPWVLDDLTQVVSEIGDKLEVVMVPKVEGAWDIHYVDRLLAQLEAKAGLTEPILVHAILETAQGVANLEEIAAASPRMQGMSFGPADLAASRRMKTTRVGGGHPGYRVISDPTENGAARQSAQQDLWHYSIGRMVDACAAVGILPFYGPFGDIKDVEGCEASSAPPSSWAASAPGRCIPCRSTSPRGLLPDPDEVASPRRSSRRSRRPRRAHDRRQDAGRRDVEAVPRDGRPRRDARREGPGARRGIRAPSERRVEPDNVVARRGRGEGLDCPRRKRVAP
jgi:malyl-CoA/(S)-citramalyl-CoA lyase